MFSNQNSFSIPSQRIVTSLSFFFFFFGGGGGVLNMLSLFSFPARFGGEIARSMNIEYVAIKSES